MDAENWHLSKSVPISFIFAIFCQTVALIWFVATLRNDVDNNKEDIASLNIRADRLEFVVQDQQVVLGRIDENIKAIKEAMINVQK